MTLTNAPRVRPLSVSDRAQWGDLWAAYLDFYGTSRGTEVFDTTFARLIGDDPQDFNAFVVECDGQLLGLVHYLFHRHCWRIENVCYLQDLFAVPEARGQGIGRQLIEAIYAAADDAGAPAVYWLTQDFNAEARKLYDRIGKLSPFIRYDRGSA